MKFQAGDAELGAAVRRELGIQFAKLRDEDSGFPDDDPEAVAAELLTDARIQDQVAYVAARGAADAFQQTVCKPRRLRQMNCNHPNRIVRENAVTHALRFWCADCERWFDA